MDAEVAAWPAQAGASLTVSAPAKLNLFLHVTGRRPDGYHCLESLMVLLDFGDTLTLAPRDDNQIVLTRPLPGVPPESDLVWRAARLLQTETGATLGVNISLAKRIPMGAGMGGGSSDAASVLLALNRCWSLGLSRSELMRIGLKLGADVPFFIFGANAHVSGIGEILRAVTVPRLHYLIEMPPGHSATAAIFADPELKRDTPVTGADAFEIGFGRNNLQPVATARHPFIATAISALDMADFAKTGRTAFGGARMTGSGAAVYRILDRGLTAREASGKRANGSLLICTRGLHSHPLREFAAK